MFNNFNLLSWGNDVYDLNPNEPNKITIKYPGIPN